MAKGDRWWEEEEEVAEVDDLKAKLAAMEAEKAAMEADAAPEGGVQSHVDAPGREQAWMEEGFDSVEDWMLYEATKDGELTEEERQAFIDRNHGGVFGLWWLSPGEAVVIGVVGLTAMLVGAFLVLSLISLPEYVYADGTIADTEVEEWTPIEAKITGDGSQWFEESFEIWEEQCYDDRCWDEFVGYEYDCYADLNLSFTFDGVEFNGIALSPAMTTTYPCLGDVESLWYDNGSVPAYMMNGPAEGKNWDDVQVFEFMISGGKSVYRQLVDIEPGGNAAAHYVYWCDADLDISYEWNGDQYSAVMSTGYWTGLEPCMSEMTDLMFSPGNQTGIWVNEGNPKEAGHDSTDLPSIGEAIVGSMCCLPIIIIILVFALVVARYNNETGQMGMGYVSNDGSRNRVKIRNNFYFGGGRRGGRFSGRGRGRRSGGSRRIRSGSRSSSGGGSGGGSRGGGSGGGSRGGGRRR